MIETIDGKSYRQLSGRRYDYWLQHNPGETETGQLICSIESFARLMALCLADESGGWLETLESVEAKTAEIVEEWPITEVLAVGGGRLVEFNNLGLKQQEVIEKN